ncbi:helix-turn-helix domain-containing protein, partial [bacterium AH-315-N03]|nr:helix-turn-helix domain-containing protein [bacterium AH-315-N03]
MTDEKDPNPDHFVQPSFGAMWTMPDHVVLTYSTLVYFRGENATAWPKQKTIARYRGRGLATIKRDIKWLEEHGLLERDRNPRFCKYTLREPDEMRACSQGCRWCRSLRSEPSD